MYWAGKLNAVRLSSSSKSGFRNSYHRLLSSVGIETIRSITPTPSGIVMVHFPYSCGRKRAARSGVKLFHPAPEDADGAIPLHEDRALQVSLVFPDLDI